LFLLALALLVSSVGCPNSSTISTGNGTVRVNVINTNGDEWTAGGLVQLDKVLVRPLDPEVNEVLGVNPLSLISDAVVIWTMQRVADSELVVGLSSGTYEIVQLDLSQASFVADPASPDSNGCHWIEPQAAITLPPLGQNFPAPLTFTVQPDTDGLLTLTWDMSALAQAIFETYNPPVDPVLEGGFCLGTAGTTDEAALADLVGTYLTVE
jgi:hypothetical protein